jgi:hypothetical protein
MSDFEGRVTEVLRSESEAAPDALGLAGAARTRAGRRRRTRVAAVGAVAVLAVAIPVGVVALGGGDGPGKTPVAGNNDAADTVPAGRWESWHGVTVQVPDDWQYGNQSTWCAGGGSADQFLITRPGGMSEMIACSPQSSYGLAFQEIDSKATDEPFDWPVVTQTGDAWPEGTFVGAHGENGVLVTVAGPDREALLDVLATVQTIEGADPHGCGPRVGDDHVVGSEGAMSVCRYDTAGALEQSELLVGSNAQDAAAALDSTVQGDLDCAPSEGPGQVVEMFDGTRDVSIELDGACTVVDGSPSGIADADVMWWALSPGWTGDATGLPLPSALRSYDPAA